MKREIALQIQSLSSGGRRAVGASGGRMGSCDELSVGRGAGKVALVNDDLSPDRYVVCLPLEFPALKRTVVYIHGVGLGRNGGFLAQRVGRTGCERA